MFESRFYRLWSVAILSVSVLIFCVSIILVLGKVSQPQVSLALDPKELEVQVGKTISMGIYFSGRDASLVNAADIKVKYDQAKLKLEKAIAGPYFNQPLVIKWQEEGARFSMAANPTISQPANQELSVVRLEFKALQKGDVQVSFEEDSKLYVAKKGGLSPTGSAGVVKIK